MSIRLSVIKSSRLTSQDDDSWRVWSFNLSLLVCSVLSGSEAECDPPQCLMFVSQYEGVHYNKKSHHSKQKHPRQEKVTTILITFPLGTNNILLNIFSLPNKTNRKQLLIQYELNKNLYIKKSSLFIPFYCCLDDSDSDVEKLFG